MKKNKKRKRIHFLRNGLDSSDFKKVVLLGIVVMSLAFSFLAFGWGKMVLRQYGFFENKKKPPSALEKKIHAMVKGYPIDKMTLYIAEKNEKTAAFLVGIAKKESDWGNHAPVLRGRDCYNYWGFRGQSRRMSWDGYTCFRNPEQAVAAVSRRLEELIQNSGLDTPEKMVAAWKCGWDCSTHSPESVSKWASDVDYYFEKFYN